MTPPSALALSLVANAALALPAAFGVAVLARRWWRARRAAQSGAASPPAPSPIPTCSLADFDPLFAPHPVFGPTLATEVRFVGRGSMHVLGGTTDVESWILAVLAKRARRLFEFGTCTGKTTYLWAVNSPAEARITTLTLPPDATDTLVRSGDVDAIAVDIAAQESVCTDFLYSGTEAEHKVAQLFGDSLAFDETPHVGACDIVFVDGAHSYTYVASDTQKALRMVRRGGIVLWHDYYGPHGGAPDVYRLLTELAARLPLVHLEGTALVAYRAEPRPDPSPARPCSP